MILYRLEEKEMNRLFVIGMLTLSLAAIAPETVLSRELKGVNVPETVVIKDTTCSLVGAGIRKKLVINVYIGALYTSRPVNSAPEAIASDQVKRIVLHFLYKEVKADQLVEAWNEGFEKNSGGSAAGLKDRIARFNSFFRDSVRTGDTIELTYIPGTGTEVTIKGSQKGMIEGKDFMEALFSIWFGPFPPSTGLKEGMLGQ